MKINLWLEEEGCEVEIDCPTKKEVCPTCNGEGTHINSAFQAQAFTQEDAIRDGLDYWDEVERMQLGYYDVECCQCNGIRVIDVPDYKVMSKELVEVVKQQIRKDKRFQAMCLAERMNGA